MKLIIVIVLTGILIGQTPKQVYEIKRQYENIVLNDSVVIVSGVSYSVDTTHYNLRYAVIEDDYVFFPTGNLDGFKYMERICSAENRYKVNIQKGLKDSTGKIIKESIWIARLYGWNWRNKNAGDK